PAGVVAADRQQAGARAGDGQAAGGVGDAQRAAGQGDGAVGRGGESYHVGAGVGVGGGDGRAQRAGATVVGGGHQEDAGHGPVLQDVQAGSEGQSRMGRLPARPLAGPGAGAATGTSDQPVQPDG